VIEPDVEVLVAQYRALLSEMHENRVETGGEPRRWNRLVNKAQAVHLQLRESEAGRAAITELAFNGENATIRDWSAANALAWEPDRVRPLLQARSNDMDLGAVDAKWTLREYDAGRLNTAWIPKRR
jgi:hypothetical protein